MNRWYAPLVAVLLAGCSPSSTSKMIPFDQLPPGMIERAQKELPDVSFESAFRKGDGSYEIRGKTFKGQVRDVEFSASGELIEVE